MNTANRLLRTARLHPRLVVSGCLVIVSYLAAPPGLTGATRLLVAWDSGALLYLVLAWVVMLRADLKRLRVRASIQDDGAAAVLSLTVLAALASLAAIVLELTGLKGYAQGTQGAHIALACLTILCSWFVVHTAFALHYAHEFYNESRPDGHAELQFPGTSDPDYIDFMYFSFVIGTTAQTSDVNISSRVMRRLALVHGVISFFFNTTLLALFVNVAAGLS